MLNNKEQNDHRMHRILTRNSRSLSSIHCNYYYYYYYYYRKTNFQLKTVCDMRHITTLF